jgi:hypothetical protein
MSARRVFQPARLLWLAPALFGLLASPSPTRAGCGDHAHAAAPGIDLASLALIDRTGLAPGDLPIPPPPCHGPSCSQQRPVAPISIPPAPRISPERGLVAPGTRAPDAPGDRPILAELEPAYESPALDHLDRPPRA